MRPTLFPERREGANDDDGRKRREPASAVWSRAVGRWQEVGTIRRGGKDHRDREGGRGLGADRGGEERGHAETLSPTARSRVDVTVDGGGRLMEGVTAASWHTVRAAVLHQLAEEYRRWRKVGDKEPDFAKAVEAAKRLGVQSSLSREWRRWSGPREPAPSRSLRAGPRRRCRGKSR